MISVLKYYYYKLIIKFQDNELIVKLSNEPEYRLHFLQNEYF